MSSRRTSSLHEPYARLLALAIMLAHTDSMFAQSTEDAHQKVIESMGPAVKQGQTPDLTKVAERITTRTNQLRGDQQRSALAGQQQLQATAQDFARFMAESSKYGHEADEQTVAQRATNHGYDGCLVLENIAYAADSRGFSVDKLASEFYQGWKESPGHLKNMLDPDVTEMAVAIARSDSSGFYYAVQLFGRPKSQSIEFQVRNGQQVELTYTLGEEAFTLPGNMVRTHRRCRSSPLTLTSLPDDHPHRTMTPASGERISIQDNASSVEVTVDAFQETPNPGNSHRAWQHN